MNIKTRNAFLLLAALLGANCSPAQPAVNQVPANKLATVATLHPDGHCRDLIRADSRN